MTDTQLYLTIGLPVFAVMMGILAGMFQMTAINARMTSLETSMGARMTSLETTMNGRFTSLESRFDTLVGKVVEIDNRLTRVEALLERH
jgi:hypothetical protein